MNSGKSFDIEYKAEVLSKAMDKSADHINTVLKYLVVLCIQQNSD